MNKLYSASLLAWALIFGADPIAAQWQVCNTSDICNSNAGNVFIGTATSAEVGIGTLSPGAILDIHSSQNAAAGIRVYNPSFGTDAGVQLLFGTNVDDRLSYIQQNGSGNSALGVIIPINSNLVSVSPAQDGVLPLIGMDGSSNTVLGNGSVVAQANGNLGVTFGVLAATECSPAILASVLAPRPLS